MPEGRTRSQLPAALLLSALLAATITLIEPAKSAIGNWSEIGIGISTLLARLVTPFAAALAGIAAFAVFLAGPFCGLAAIRSSVCTSFHCHTDMDRFYQLSSDALQNHNNAITAKQDQKLSPSSEICCQWLRAVLSGS